MTADTGRGADQIPVTLIGGYLGSGKTTIVNRLLAESDGRRIAVLVNDVGAVNVDAALIAAHAGTTIELTNGCVCCAITDDFGAALDRVRRFVPPIDHVIVELSGVAEPARIAPWANTTGFVLAAIIVLADAGRISDLLADSYVGDAVARQLASADLVLVTKCDLQSATQLGQAEGVIAVHTAAPQIQIANGVVTARLLLERRGSGGAPPGGSSNGASEHAHDTAVVDVGQLSFDELARRIEELPDTVVRAKALITCIDRDHPVEVQVVGASRTLTVRDDLDASPEPTSLVVITRATMDP